MTETETKTSTSTTASRIDRLAELLLPHRFLLGSILWIAALVSSVTPLNAMVFPFGTGVTKSLGVVCEFPDLCMEGYTPEELLAWYHAIGADGRVRYFWIAAYDLLLLIPHYTAVLLLELYLLWPQQPQMLLLPVFAALLDYVETLTHLYGTVVVHTSLAPVPSESWLAVASWCTRTKFACLGLAMLAIGGGIVARFLRAVPAKRKIE